MPETSTLVLFVVAAVALLITPGPAVLYIVARSVDQGRMAGIVSGLGLGVGTIVHVSAAALGLSALLVSSALAFGIVKYLGAAYLIYLGIRKLLERDGEPEPRSAPRASLDRVFVQGIIVNVLNPKAALFVFAFLPQFVDPAAGSVAAQILVLGCVLVGLGVVSDGLYAIAAGTVGEWLRGHRRVWAAERYVVGGVYVALGLATALTGARRK